MLYYEGWAPTEAKMPQTEPLEHWQGTLLRAADLIEQIGWCKNRHTDDAGRVCASQAITEIARDGDQPFHHEMTAKWHLREYLNAPSVEMWNDMPSRTMPQVLAALREAATKSKKER